MAWTSAAEVIAAWIGDDAPTDTAKVDYWIGRAERMLRGRVPSVDLRMVADPVTEPDLPDNVKDVVISMVQRVFRNPEGVRTRQETTGPFSGSVTLGGDQPGTLWITDDELALVSPTGSSSGAFTIDMIPATSRFSGSYVSLLNDWETA